jgi:ribonuclease P protein subunit RPR2
MRDPRRRRDSVLPEVRGHHPSKRPGHGDSSFGNLETKPPDSPRSHDSAVATGPMAPARSRLHAASSIASGREALSKLQQRDIGGLRRLPGMRGPGSSRRRGRRGRRTAAMIRAAQERIQDLFSLAETEVRRSPENFSRRYVLLARRIGMRYNVRLLREYRDVYCRGCSAFWVEGRSVRTRLRAGRRAQTCLNCGRVRRTRIKHRPTPRAPSEESPDRTVGREQAVLIDEGLDAETESDFDEGEGQ